MRQRGPAKFSEFEISKHSVGVTVKRTEEMTADQRAAVLFGRQHGAASDRQLRSSAFSWEKQQRMIRNNLWRRYSAGVILLVGSPETWHQRAMAATLATSGALLSGPAAARLHRLDGFATTTTLQIVIPVDGHDRSPAGVAIRWSRRLTNADRYVVDGIPVTTLAVTLIHLHADGLAAEKALDSVRRQRKPPQWLKQTFERWQIGDTRARPRICFGCSTTESANDFLGAGSSGSATASSIPNPSTSSTNGRYTTAPAS